MPLIKKRKVSSTIITFSRVYANLGLHPTEITSLATKAGEGAQAVISKLNELSLANEGVVSFESFLQAVSKLKLEKGSTYMQKDDKKIVLHGHMENTTHTINVDEKESFVAHINQALAGDKHIGARLPIDPCSMMIFPECKGKFFDSF